MKKVVNILAAGYVLTGCAYLTPPFEHPIIEQHAQDRINTFAVIPSRRMMIVKSEENPDKTKERVMLVCAEAPADVTDNLASTLAASLAVSGKAADASAALSRTLSTLGQNLFKRTQGIQLFRDRSYHLCQARMNGFITNDQYNSSINDAFLKVIPLIEKELAHIQQNQPTTTSSQPSPLTAPEVGSEAGGAKPA
jgi:hypothetical protein